MFSFYFSVYESKNIHEVILILNIMLISKFLNRISGGTVLRCKSGWFIFRSCLSIYSFEIFYIFSPKLTLILVRIPWQDPNGEHSTYSRWSFVERFCVKSFNQPTLVNVDNLITLFRSFLSTSNKHKNFKSKNSCSFSSYVGSEKSIVL